MNFLPVKFDFRDYVWKFKEVQQEPQLIIQCKEKKLIVKPSRTWQELSISEYVLTKNTYKPECYNATPVCIYRLRDKAKGVFGSFSHPPKH
jgi:hypothetical protein